MQTRGIWNGWMRFHFCKLLKDVLTLNHECSSLLVTHQRVWCDQDRMFNSLQSWNLMNTYPCSIAYILLEAFVINTLLWDVLFYADFSGLSYSSITLKFGCLTSELMHFGIVSKEFWKALAIFAVEKSSEQESSSDRQSYLLSELKLNWNWN